MTVVLSGDCSATRYLKYVTVQSEPARAVLVKFSYNEVDLPTNKTTMFTDMKRDIQKHFDQFYIWLAKLSIDCNGRGYCLCSSA